MVSSLINNMIYLQVCEEQQCEEQVFPLAVSYMDRFLQERAISRQQLQLLAVTAMLLASKFRQCHPLSVDLLCAYTDNSVYPHEVRVRLFSFYRYYIFLIFLIYGRGIYFV